MGPEGPGAFPAASSAFCNLCTTEGTSASFPSSGIDHCVLSRRAHGSRLPRTSLSLKEGLRAWLALGVPAPPSRAASLCRVSVAGLGQVSALSWCVILHLRGHPPLLGTDTSSCFCPCLGSHGLFASGSGSERVASPPTVVEGHLTSHSGEGSYRRKGPGEMGWVLCPPHSWQPAPLQHQEGILSAPTLPCKHRAETPGKSLRGPPRAPWVWGSLYSNTVPPAHT